MQLPQYFTVYYPTKDRDGNSVKDNLTAFCQILASRHGGCTVQEAQGFDGVTGVSETIKQVKVFCQIVDLAEVQEYALNIREELNQDAVFYEVNGTAYITE